ncbi:MAG: proteasome assembly chaperone family protein [Methanomassiliicoccales archaeon]|nr:MAG: proteasome assembly chaperone family protein [Methanomassiliicoccales archaeon]
MENVIVNYLEKPDIKDPILIEGLPGVGNVGKLAAEHLIDELHAVKFAALYSKHFPPQVLVGENGVAKLVNNEFHFVKSSDKAQKDLIILIGDYQGMTPEGQYELASKVLDVAKEFGVKKIFTLGGYGMGKVVKYPRVLGATTTDELVKEMMEYGITFPKGEPGSGIVGASGLLLGLGKLMGMESVCLMGETSGYFADPKAAQAVLEVLTKILNVKIDFKELEMKAKEIDYMASKLKDLERTMTEGQEEDLNYFG